MKSKILQTLREDHANQAQLLALIEAEIAKLSGGMEAPDYELISLALEYCTDYPSRCHHPREDLIYVKLLQRDPQFGTRAAVLTEDHRDLESLIRKFAEAVGGTMCGRDPRQLRQTGERFLHHYRHHMSVEEREIFPRASECLTDDDWQEIEDAYEEVSDPLFGDHTRQAYIALQRRIVDRTRVC